MKDQVNILTDEIAEKEKTLKETVSENTRLCQKLIAAGINPDE